MLPSQRAQSKRVKRARNALCFPLLFLCPGFALLAVKRRGVDARQGWGIVRGRDG